MSIQQQRHFIRVNEFRTEIPFAQCKYENTKSSPLCMFTVRYRRSKRDHTVVPPKKLKTKKSVSKRFRFTADGRIKRLHAYKQHHACTLRLIKSFVKLIFRGQEKS